MVAPMLKFSSSTINDMIYLTNVRSESLLDRFFFITRVVDYRREREYVYSTPVF
jgi:hypothetical protein